MGAPFRGSAVMPLTGSTGSATKASFPYTHAHSGMYNQGQWGGLEVSAMCNFVMTNEVLGSVSIDYLRPNTADTTDDDRIRIVGAEGVIEVRERKSVSYQ